MTSRNRGRPKLRDLMYHKPTTEEAGQIIDAAVSGHPMVAAILGAITIELELESLLRERFPKANDENWGTMVSDGGPLYTFDQKITMAFFLGTIDEATRDNLKIIRQIRNTFAHARKVLDFEHELIKAELSKIKIPKFKKRRHSELVEIADNSPQKVYVTLCIIIATYLIKKANYNWSAKKRRRNKKLSPFARIFIEAANQSKYPESNPRSSPQSQTDDPIPPVQGGYAGGLLAFLNQPNPYAPPDVGKPDKK